jgi:hypothetical protein
MAQFFYRFLSVASVLWAFTGLQSALAVGQSPYVQGYISGSSGTYEEHLEKQKTFLESEGFRKWNWANSGKQACLDCQLFLLPANTQLESDQVYAYLQTLEQEKATLLKLYPSDPHEYNYLAQVSVGILGRESLFFRAKRYFVKEYFQPGVNFTKLMRKYLGFIKGVSSRNSRGPTQIKDIPEKISQFYKVFIK